MMDYIIDFYSNFDVFLLIVIRLAGFFILVPVFGGQTIPATVRIGICFFISLIIMSSNNITFQLEIDSVFNYGFVIAKELVVGLIMGFVVYFLFSMIYYAGQMIDYQIGFSMVSVFDPTSQLQVPITGNLIYFLTCVIMLVTNAHFSLLSALFYSYQALPIDSASFLSGNLLGDIMNMMVSFLVIGYRIALPVTGSILILDVSLGLLTKAAPQINIFSFGMSFKLFMGLILLFALIPMFITVSEHIFVETNRSLLKIIRDLMP